MNLFQRYTYSGIYQNNLIYFLIYQARLFMNKVSAEKFRNFKKFKIFFLFYLTFKDDIKYLFGIISYGSGCGSTFPGIYTRIDKYLDWIEREMTALG